MANKHRYKNEIILLTKTGHRVADDIFHELKKTYPYIGIWSVYRNLTELVEESVLMKQEWLANKIIYEAKKPHHGHIFCKASGYIQDIDISMIAMQDLPIPDNFLPESMEITIQWYFKNNDWEICNLWGFVEQWNDTK